MTEATTKTVRLTRWLKAEPQRVFAAWTDPAQVTKWWTPADDIDLVASEVDARVGGVLKLGYRRRGTEHVNVILGRYTDVDPPSRLVFTWAWQPPHDEFPDDQLDFESTVTVELTAVDGGTQINLTHEGLPAGELAERHDWGWNGALDHLVGYAGV